MFGRQGPKSVAHMKGRESYHAKEVEKNNDRDGYADQPQKYASHVSVSVNAPIQRQDPVLVPMRASSDMSRSRGSSAARNSAIAESWSI